MGSLGCEHFRDKIHTLKNGHHTFRELCLVAMADSSLSKMGSFKRCAMVYQDIKSLFSQFFRRAWWCITLCAARKNEGKYARKLKGFKVDSSSLDQIELGPFIHHSFLTTTSIINDQNQAFEQHESNAWLFILLKGVVKSSLKRFMILQVRTSKWSKKERIYRWFICLFCARWRSLRKLRELMMSRSFGFNTLFEVFHDRFHETSWRTSKTNRSKGLGALGFDYYWWILARKSFQFPVLTRRRKENVVWMRQHISVVACLEALLKWDPLDGEVCRMGIKLSLLRIFLLPPAVIILHIV